MKKKTRSHRPERVNGMTPETAQLIVDILSIEDALNLREDREGVLLAAALAEYRGRLEKKGGFVRLQPDQALEWLKHIKVQKGNGWLKLIDTRVKKNQGMK
jgi:hypothetical protein